MWKKNSTLSGDIHWTHTKSRLLSFLLHCPPTLTWWSFMAPLCCRFSKDHFYVLLTVYIQVRILSYTPSVYFVVTTVCQSGQHWGRLEMMQHKFKARRRRKRGRKDPKTNWAPALAVVPTAHKQYMPTSLAVCSVVCFGKCYILLPCAIMFPCTLYISIK